MPIVSATWEAEVGGSPESGGVQGCSVLSLHLQIATAL